MVTFKELGNLGRLGNQLFQIASTIGIANENKDEFLFPLWEYSKYFSNPIPQTNIIELEKKDFHKIQEAFFSYYHIITNRRSVDLNGYFQSEKYFENCKDIIKSHFVLKDRFLKEIIYLDQIKNKETCSIHVRRGDYVNLKNIYTELLLENYYNEAISLFHKDITFLIFSDDIQWCKENIKGKNIIFVEGQKDIYDLILMSKCTHNIIANSSFSWWGAWLNENIDKKIIAPESWFASGNNMPIKDLIPEKWTKIKIK